MLYQPNDTLLNKYRIESFIGSGAFAEVYRATHLALNAPRALKVLNRDASGIGSTEFGDYEQRFRFEAQLGAAIDHPHIVRVYDFEQDGDLLVLVMAYAEDGSLAARIQRQRELQQPMLVEDAVRIAQEIAQGLAALHELDAVHRDVKPSNILFDNDGRAMLADLGLAQAPGGPSMRSVMSQTMSHPGTPAYMSPEQVEGFGHLSPSSDVYALGTVLFEMLTGRLYKNMRPDTTVSKYRKDTPDWLVEVLGRMMAKDPEDRPWDGEEVGEMLQRSEVGGQRSEAGRGAPLRSPNLATAAAETLTKKQTKQQAQREEKEKARLQAEEDSKRREQAAVEKARKEAAERARRENEDAERKRQTMLRRLKIPETVKVPAGEFTMGSDKDKYPDAGDTEIPQHQVYVDAFEIGKFPVTNEEYATFIRATGNTPPAHWKGGEVPKTIEQHPVVNVSWHDAVAYCKWLSEITYQNWRLPTEAEWEKAARGTTARKYPWGHSIPDRSLCNFAFNVKDTTPVGRFPTGASPYGALDMSGNVWEWTSTLFKSYPYTSGDGREDPVTAGIRVLRGGSWSDCADGIRCTHRYRSISSDCLNYKGFRIVRSQS